MNTGVWKMYGKSTINAPASEVWKVVRDICAYDKWNAYTSNFRTPSGTSDVKVDDMITLAYRPEPVGKLMDVPCQIIEVNDKDMRIRWRGLLVPAFFLLAEKTQRVTQLEDGKCLYEIFETQGRAMAYVTKWMLEEKLNIMTQGIADALKTYIEGSQGGRTEAAEQ